MLSNWKTRLPYFANWPETATLEGIAVPIRQSPFPPWLRRHIMNGGYETAERLLVQALITEADQVLELGASAGVLTSFLWRQVGIRGRVVSVEGNANLKPTFEAQQALNGFRGEWIESLCYPTWDEMVPEASGLKSFRLASNPLASTADERFASGAIPVDKKPEWKTARQICEATGLVPTVLVADIEGTEGVWADTSPCIPSTVSKAIVEFHPEIIGPLRTGRCIQALISEGFAITGLCKTVMAFERA